MATSRIIALSALSFVGRIFGCYLPFAIEAAFRGEISWGELRPFFAYLIRVDAGAVESFEGSERPYKPTHGA